MTESEKPEHLDGIEKIKNGIFQMAPDAEQYAEMAFALNRVASGDTEAFEKVSSYIQRGYAREKMMYEKLVKVKSGISSWIGWAASWTCRKSDT